MSWNNLSELVTPGTEILIILACLMILALFVNISAKYCFNLFFYYLLFYVYFLSFISLFYLSVEIFVLSIVTCFVLSVALGYIVNDAPPPHCKPEGKCFMCRFF